MIENLPIRLTASAGEPGFSVLVRNAAANASRTTKEFCAATGLSKALVCAGDIEQLCALAKLTASDPTQLHLNSPQQLDRKTSVINGNKVLTRSLRKADLSICPQCWLEQLEASGSKTYQLSMRSAWLLRPVRTCIQHGVRLVELPYKDYTTCYDHPVRCKLSYGWLGSLPSFVDAQIPCDFEVAALDQTLSQQPICPWLGDIQVDVFERWCLGLGLFLEHGASRLVDVDQNAQCHLIDLGYSVTIAGRAALHVAVDQALGKHGIRLGMTWLYNWVFQNLAADERLKFREQMKEMCDAQGDHCLLTVAPAPPISRVVDLQIKKLARHTGRSASWVRNALISDGHLPQCGAPEQRYVNNRFEQWRTHILSLHNGLPKVTAAKHLGIGCVGFDNLVKDGVLRPIKSRIFAKPRFDPVMLDAFMAAVERHLRPIGENTVANALSITEACFATSCATSTVVKMLIDGHLKSAFISEQNRGIAGIRIDPVELKTKLASFSKTGLSIEELRDILGLQYKQVKQMIARGYLSAFTGRKSGSNRTALLVDPSDLETFLGEFQTVRTAASRLGISENALRVRISNSRIVRAPEGGGMLVYRTAEILAI